MPSVAIVDGKKLVTVFRDENGLWMAASLPFPSLEYYGSTDDGLGACETREQAEQIASEAGCRIVPEEEALRDWI